MSESIIEVELHQQSDYQFITKFGGEVPALLCDEPPPLGAGTGPSPVQLLAAAVGNCLSDSLLYALRKFKQHPEPLQTRVVLSVGRNEQGRLRVLHIKAILKLGVQANTLEHLASVLSQFESFCTVSQSVGLGIPIETRVEDVNGLVLKGPSP